MESAIVSADVADAAVQGTGPFKKSGPMTELRSIGNVGQLVLHVLVAKEARFQDFSALNGKRIAIGVEDSDNAVTARFLLRAAGINEKKTKLVTGDPEAAALDVLGDKLDALVLVAQLPNEDVAALMRTGNYKLLSAKPSDDNKSGYVVADWIKHKQYSGTDVVRPCRAGRVGGALLAVGRTRRRPCQGAAARRWRRSQDPPEHRSIDRPASPRRPGRTCRARQGRRGPGPGGRATAERDQLDRLSHFLRRTGNHFGGKFSKRF